MKVVIIGAGPAGLITSLNLLEKGATPLILEKEPEIKSTACGEALSLRRLAEIPFPSAPYIAKKACGVKMFFPGGSVDQLDIECAVLDRTGWLQGMAQEVTRRGAKVRLSAEVSGINAASITLKSGEQLEFDILIGADGPGSCVARHLGLKHATIVASQYRIAYDTRDMDYLEFYFDKRFSFGYAWIFPKEGTVNVGSGGNFTQLDAFLRDKGLDRYEIITKEAGTIPASGIGKLVRRNIALIGDAASMPNPMTLGGLSPIVLASHILAENLDNLAEYEKQVRSHPMASPVLLRAGRALVDFSNDDLAGVGEFLDGINKKRGRAPTPKRIARFPALLPKLGSLRTLYKAGRITLDYGW